MKRLLSILTFFSILIITSCGGDDDVDDNDLFPPIGLSGTVDFDGQSYTIANGALSLFKLDRDVAGHFHLTDGTITVLSNGIAIKDSEIIISVSALSKGNSTLVNGDYTTRPDSVLFMDIGVQTGPDPQGAVFGSGTVNINGSGNTYAMIFDVSFEQGATLTGTVSGTYELD